MSKPATTHQQITAGFKTKARARLDAIRDLLLLPHPPRNRVCSTCGAECSPVAVCRVCGGKQVNAENILRSIRDYAKVGD